MGFNCRRVGLALHLPYDFAGITDWILRPAFDFRFSCATGEELTLMPVLVFDIETGPLPAMELSRMRPEFDPASVKVGNLKDEAKIAAKVETAREEHETKFFDKAALSALTGQVIVIGYKQAGGQAVIEELDEPQVLGTFWNRYQWCIDNRVSLVGWNILQFDLPFIVRRSWFHGITVPESIQQKGRYWNSIFVDLMQRWSLGAYGQYEKLHNAAKYFGHDGKNGDGAEFAKLWNDNRQQAIAYLENDLEMTELVASSMGEC